MNKQRGFTLIEMLVAMTLLALLGLMLTGSIGFGGRVADAASSKSARLDQVWTALALTRSQLQSARPPASKDDTGVFRGEADGVAFIAPAPPRLASGAAQKVMIRLDGPTGGRKLVAEWRPTSGNAEPRRSVLIDGLAGGALAYYGPTTAGQPARWSTSWTGRDALPQLIRLDLAFTDGTPVNLEVSPRLSRSDR